MITTIIRRVCVASNGSGGGAAVAAHPRRCCGIPRVGRRGLAKASSARATPTTTGRSSLFSVKTTTATAATTNNNGGRTRQMPIVAGAAAVVARFPPPTPLQQQHHRCKKSTVAASIEDDDQDAQALAAAAAVATATASTPYDNNAIVDDETTATAFPSLIIRAGDGDGSSTNIEALGSFAQSQAAYLNPDPDAVRALRDKLVETDTGIVAHYYMDVELQGILMAVKKLLPNRVGIADSLKMGDMAVDMVEGEGGARRMICLGVDFMSESVQAILRQKGHADVPVYRADARAIGCSLAESAETDAYRAWLQQRQKLQTPQEQIDDAASACFLHVVYINTSLETKAVSNSLVPTIACTSSNVLQTLLQASAQVGPDRLRVLYGPDTYMGENLVALLRTLLSQKTTTTTTTTTTSSGQEGSSSFVWTDDKIRSDLHPQHTRDSLRTLADNLHVYPAGNCVVHHMFGEAVVDRVERDYIGLPHTYVTAHLEVPGEMFRLAMEKSLLDEGVVGSTSDILRFIQSKVQEHAAASASAPSAGPSSMSPLRLRFILGTEAGMVTSIVQSVQDILNSSPNPGAVEAEIIFPVAQEAVTVVNDNDDSAQNDNSANHHNLSIVPGVSGGEGCSTAGGCATCPFMKMNSLEALLDVLDMVAEEADADTAAAQDDNKHATTTSTTLLERHLPPDRLGGKFLSHRPAVEVGSEPILYMREFMKRKRLPDQLVARIVATSGQQ